jgi:hypothetical protein
MLQRVSWQAEKLFRQRDSLQTYLLMTIDRSRLCQTFEHVCDRAPDRVADSVLLDALRRELAVECALDHVVAFAVAFPGHYIEVLAESILSREPSERRTVPVVALEAHTADEHLRSHREIVRVGGKPRLTALAPVDASGEMQFADLLPSLVST